VPDLERLISRIHAGRCKQSDFLKVVDAFDKISNGFEKLAKASEDFETNSVSGLIRGCPDLTSFRTNLKKLYRLEEGCT
jgi:DNA mismatch repair protein MSH6